MSNNQEEIAIRRMEAAIQRFFGRFVKDSPEEPPHGSYFGLALGASAFVGASALVGGWSMTFPIILFAIALICGLWEIYERRRKHSWSVRQVGCWTVLLLLFMGTVGYLAYDVFHVDMRVRFADIRLDRNFSPPGSSILLAVKLTNRGKATSLTEWKAYITMPDGTHVNGDLRELFGDNIPIQARNASVPTSYRLPECDLGIETTKAMENGDSIYGITEFGFPISSTRNWNGMKITLAATDVLGRTISNTYVLGSDSNSYNFPCPKKTVDKK